ncbi:MAG TPA: hypothetical protein VFP65_14405 [Anaeromyxobacteraceae bacterium]|nr:hypothetical protein [Anaeromyxobacteraceae bacterium]
MKRPDPAHRAGAPARAALLLLLLASAACGKDMSVKLRAGDRPPNPDTPTPVPSGLAGRRVLAGGVAIDRFQIVFRDMKLQENPTADGSAAPGDQPIAPSLLLVDLSGAQLDKDAMTEIVAPRDVAWASYYQTVIGLAPVTADEAAANPALAPLAGRTLVITGRLPGGAPFTFASSMSAVLVRPSTFRNGLNHNNVTVNVELNRWFAGPDGVALDPTDPASQATIETNIRQSIDAYMDDNRDGEPDPLG